MRQTYGIEILAAVRDARQALITPGLASIARAQDCLATADAALRRARDGGHESLPGEDWKQLRRELAMLQEFSGGVQQFLATTLDVPPAANAGRLHMTGACVSWSG
jgi:hypothetical protein